ncbi:MAG: hypothetical protein DSM106950_26210 [Stigonema ocellatum SAG 48.90 = DSM 106950]|nr:hypothetical protein [Stigonema ocellatum SAG 48.90 = DSM 106950]
MNPGCLSWGLFFGVCCLVFVVWCWVLVTNNQLFPNQQPTLPQPTLPQSTTNNQQTTLPQPTKKEVKQDE